MANFLKRRVFGELPISAGLIQDYNAINMSKQDLLQPKIDLEMILGIQALGMTIHSQARTRLQSRDKKHGFSMLENSDTKEDEFYDDSLEEYMTFRVAKTDLDQWRMHVRFRQNQLSQDKNTESYLEDYHFDWLKNGNRMAFYSLKAIARGQGDENGITIETFKDIHALTNNDAQELQERMTVHSDKVTVSTLGKL